MGENTATINKETRVSREQLYEEVWAEPMTTVALKYEVSSSFMARICTRLKVPRPPRGYWAMYPTTDTLSARRSRHRARRISFYWRF